MRKGFCLLFCVFSLIVFSPAVTFADSFSDDFEDGIISSSLWVTNGSTDAGGIGGSWQYSFDEVIATDGYLEARVWGPTSGNTYGAEASVRTAKNFNDGGKWLINFSWETTVSYEPHFDVFAVQITDGGFPVRPNAYWIWNDLPEGTQNLWFSTSDDSYPPGKFQPYPPFTRRTWSITVDPTGVASFYQSADATGSVISEISLDLTKNWYVRFVNLDATSAGFDAGDNTFRVYDFFAEPLSICTDTDSDGICDDGDASGTAGDNPCTGGAIENCDDNCPNESNPDQGDSDSDGIGDVCEPDSDGDGVPDDDDAFPSDPNESQDSDGDGVGDNADACPDTVAGDAVADNGCSAAQRDADGDGCEGALGTGEDCDDSDPAIHPGADEVCDDGKDNDCDGATDGADSECPCVDNDGDGYGSPGNSTCPNGPEEDCNDGNGAIHPGATEIPCDGIDQDCSGLDYCCQDSDGDGYGVCPDCGTSAGCTYEGDDCNDGDPTVNPGASEVCDNSRDDDCDGSRSCLDTDCAGASVCSSYGVASQKDIQISIPGSGCFSISIENPGPYDLNLSGQSIAWIGPAPNDVETTVFSGPLTISPGDSHIVDMPCFDIGSGAQAGTYELDIIWSGTVNGNPVEFRTDPSIILTSSGGGGGSAAVGGTAEMANKFKLLAPWMALFFSVSLCVGIVLRRMKRLE